jgi:hypothetical protein
MKGFRLVLAMTAVALLAAPASAQASFHFMDVREVYPGSTANPTSEYVVLQMYSSGQNLVNGHTLKLYGPCGFPCDTGTATFPTPNTVLNGNDQQTILLATPAAETQFGVAADMTLTGDALNPAGGAACWATDQPTPVDCVAWGSFPMSAGVGNPAAAIPDGMALQRTIAPNCSTLLEPGDDTNDSATDFFAATPNPRNNASAIVEHACPPPDTTPPITVLYTGPSGLMMSTSATFTFDSSELGSTFECALDSAGFSGCSSPQDYTGLGQGQHTFLVRAIDGAGNPDPTPESRSFTVDTVPPDTTITSGPAAVTPNKNPTFGFVSSDAGAYFECKVDGAAFAYCGTSPRTIATVADGAHRFYVRAVDVAGNADPTPASRAFTVDTTAPNARITGIAVRNTTAIVSFSGRDNRAGALRFQCKLDGGRYARCGSPKAYKGLALGTHRVWVRATDIARNIDFTPATKGFRILPPG